MKNYETYTKHLATVVLTFILVTFCSAISFADDTKYISTFVANTIGNNSAECSMIEQKNGNRRDGTAYANITNGSYNGNNFSSQRTFHYAARANTTSDSDYMVSFEGRTKYSNRESIDYGTIYVKRVGKNYTYNGSIDYKFNGESMTVQASSSNGIVSGTWIMKLGNKYTQNTFKFAVTANEYEFLSVPFYCGSFMPMFDETAAVEDKTVSIPEPLTIETSTGNKVETSSDTTSVSNRPQAKISNNSKVVKEINYYNFCNLKPKAKRTGKKIKVKFHKLQNNLKNVKYTVQVSDSKKFKKVSTVKTKKTSIAFKKFGKKKFKKGKTYYVRVKATYYAEEGVYETEWEVAKIKF
jgi:hypothetical protein